MKSGDFTKPYGIDDYSEEFADIMDPVFVQRTFVTRSALVARALVNGCRVTKDYHGEHYDPELYDLVPGTWDHEHCSVCLFTICDDHTYWENGERIKLLCDACHEVYQRGCGSSAG